MTRPDALQRLIDCQGEFVRFLSPRVGGNAAAEDLVQIGFLRAIERKEDLAEHENVVAWFYTVLRNLLIDHHRSNAVIDRKRDEFYSELEATGAHEAFQETELGRAICECMTDLIGTLPEQYVEVLRKVDLEGRALTEVATELGTNKGALAVKLHRARQALKKRLKQMCGACTKHGCLDCSCK